MRDLQIDTFDAKIVPGGDGFVDGVYKRLQIEFADDVEDVFRIGQPVVVVCVIPARKLVDGGGT